MILHSDRKALYVMTVYENYNVIAFKTCIQIQARLWLSKLGVDTILGGHNLSPLVEIGLRWLPKLGVDTSPRPHAHRGITGLNSDWFKSYDTKCKYFHFFLFCNFVQKHAFRVFCVFLHFCVLCHNFCNN